MDANEYTCSVDGCVKVVYGRGKCQPHWRKEWKSEFTGVCKLDGCDRKIHVKKEQLCRLHYERVRRTGEYGPIETLMGEYGKGCVVGGYRKIKINGVAFSEHRLIMERELGRPLRDDETVHHINGDTLDNRPENLQLRQGSHGKGVKLMCGDCGSHNVTPVKLDDV